MKKRLISLVKRSQDNGQHFTISCVFINEENKLVKVRKAFSHQMPISNLIEFI